MNCEEEQQNNAFQHVAQTTIGRITSKNSSSGKRNRAYSDDFRRGGGAVRQDCLSGDGVGGALAQALVEVHVDVVVLCN